MEKDAFKEKAVEPAAKANFATGDMIESIGGVAVAREQAGNEEDGGHQQGALHGDAEAGEQGVGGGEREA